MHSDSLAKLFVEVKEEDMKPALQAKDELISKQETMPLSPGLKNLFYVW